MTAWGTIRPALVALVAELSEILTVWEDQSRPYVPDAGADARAVMLLSTGRVRGRGQDTRQNHDMTSATSAVALTNTFTLAAHGLVENDRVSFDVAELGALPGGLTFEGSYYVIAAGLTANEYRVSTTLGGSEVDLTSAGTGVRVSKLGQDLEEGVLGYRRFALTCKCESYEQGDTRYALEYTERVRDRLAWTSSLSALHAAGLGMVGIAEVVQLPTEIRDGRAVSIAAVDVQLFYTAAERDTAHRFPAVKSFTMTPDLDGAATALAPAVIGA